jgi:hypothetical protein
MPDIWASKSLVPTQHQPSRPRQRPSLPRQRCDVTSGVAAAAHHLAPQHGRVADGAAQRGQFLQRTDPVAGGSDQSDIAARLRRYFRAGPDQQSASVCVHQRGVDSHPSPLVRNRSQLKPFVSAASCFKFTCVFFAVNN